MPRLTMAAVAARAKDVGMRIKKERGRNGVTVYYLVGTDGPIANPDSGALMHMSLDELLETISSVSGGDDR